MDARPRISFKPPSEGFWLAVELVETDLANGWPSDVAEGPGGKIALAAFTGDATVTDFYAAFEDAMVAGTVATETESCSRGSRTTTLCTRHRARP